MEDVLILEKKRINTGYRDIYMNFDTQEEKNSEIFDRQSLFLTRKEKLRKEILSAKRLIEKGVPPLEVADQFFHDTFKILEERIIIENPGLLKEELKQKVLKNLNLARKIKSLRNRS